jgi:hypothetical protein
MGNHEFYAGVGVSEDFTRKAGFRMLRNEGITIDGIMNVAGVDDDAAHRSSGRHSPGRDPCSRGCRGTFSPCS